MHIKYNLNLWNKKANLTEQTIFSGAISKLKFIFLPFYIERVISIVPRVPACHRDTRRLSPVTIVTPEKKTNFYTCSDCWPKFAEGGFMAIIVDHVRFSKIH